MSPNYIHRTNVRDSTNSSIVSKNKIILLLPNFKRQKIYLAHYLSNVHGSFWPHGTDDLIWRIIQKAFEVLKQCVFVFIQESNDVVHNIPCIVSVEHKFKFFPLS
jgi:hypothetical protein